jgi:hypothetical protein
MPNKRIVGEFRVPFYGFVQHDGDEFTVGDLVEFCGVQSSEDIFRFVMDDEMEPIFLDEFSATVQSVSAVVDSEADVYFASESAV